MSMAFFPLLQASQVFWAITKLTETLNLPKNKKLNGGTIENH